MDEITVIRGVLGTAPEPALRVRAQARASLERQYGGNHAPARHGRRAGTRSAVIAAVSASAAAGVAVAVIAATPGHPAAHRPAAGSVVETTAYVLKRTAAAQADAYHLIGVEQDPDTGSLLDGTTYVDAATRQLRFISYQRTLGGQPVLEELISRKGLVEVDYRDRVYFGCLQGVSADCAGTPDTSIIQDALPGLGQEGNGWLNPAAAFRAAVAQGRVTVAGHRSLDGHDTILLRIRQTARRSPQPPQTEVWVDARTYLVAQETYWTPDVPNGATVDPAAPGPMKLTPRTTRVSWLPPTPANLAMLDLPPWAGFTPVNDQQLAHYLGIYG